MRSTGVALLVVLLLAAPALGEIAIVSKEAMVRNADFIATVTIQELVSTDLSRVYVDLTARAAVNHVLKGKKQDSITFRIPRFFPGAAFDVSTGSHLVFLKKDEQGNYTGVNWYVSYVHLTAPKVKWYDKNGAVNPEVPQEAILEEVRKLIREAEQKAASTASDDKTPRAAEVAEDDTKDKEKPAKGSHPYVVTSLQGSFYAKCTPKNEASESAGGTTKVYKVRNGSDKPLDSYAWYAPRQQKTGLLLEWSPTAKKVAIMRMHEEPEPFTAERIELSFYLGGKLLRSYTVKELVALGTNPEPGSHPDYTRQWLRYRIAGNWAFGPRKQRCWAVFTDSKQLYVDFVTGEIVDTQPIPKPR